MRTLLRLLPVCAVAAATLLLPAAAGAQNPTLTATVGPGFTISLTDASGAAVTRLDPGTYTINVSDKADIHNFRLQGPDVNVATEVEEVVDTTWTVTLKDGTYTFVCDPHSTGMNGSFTVGTGAAAEPEPVAPKAAAPKPVKAKRLNAVVGPGFTISVPNARNLRAGAYVIVVRDRSAMHNFHLTGPGVRKSTTVPFRGTATWRVNLREGTYRFVCDPHKSGMKGSFRVLPAT
jgi:plastocyanin